MRRWTTSQASLSGRGLLYLLVLLSGCKTLQQEPSSKPTSNESESWVKVSDFDCSPTPQGAEEPPGEGGNMPFESMRAWASGGPAGATWNAGALTCRGQVWTSCTQGSIRVELLVGSRRAATQAFPAAEVPPRIEFPVPEETWRSALDDTVQQDFYRTAILRLRASLTCEEPFLAGAGTARHSDVVAEDSFVAGFASGE